MPPPVQAPPPALRSYLVFFDFNKSGLTAQATEIVDTAAKGKRDLLVPTGDGVREPRNRRVQIVYGAGPPPDGPISLEYQATGFLLKLIFGPRRGNSHSSALVWASGMHLRKAGRAQMRS